LAEVVLVEQCLLQQEYLEQILLLDQLLLEPEEAEVVQHQALKADPEVKTVDLLVVEITEILEDLLLYLLMELVQQLKVMLVEMEILETKAAVVAAEKVVQVEICLDLQLEPEDLELLQI
jgi:hypothetical protein